MDSFLNYLIEANIGLLMFLLCYQFILQKETSYRFTRFFLLAGIIVSVIFPLIHAHSKGEASIFSIGGVLPSLSLPELVVEDSSQNVKTGADQLTGLWMWIYGSVSFLFAVGFAVNLRAIIKKIKSSNTCRRGRFSICESNTNHPTFSFFNFIFIGESNQLTEDEKAQIIRHEMVHGSHYHTIDILTIQVLRIFFWFNPFLSAYKNAIVQTHEFEADAVAAGAVDSNQYCHLLAKISLQSNGFPLANHFNHSLTVKRIAMIRTVKDQISFWKMAICCVTIAAAFFLLSCEDQLRTRDNDVISSSVDEHAYPKEGREEFYTKIRKAVRYPISSRRDQSTGKLLIQFVVNENGTLSDVEILNSPDAALAEEGRRIMALATEWVPAKKDGAAVKERIVIPIRFMLNGVTKTTDDAASDQNAHSFGEIVVVGYTKETQKLD